MAATFSGVTLGLVKMREEKGLRDKSTLAVSKERDAGTRVNSLPRQHLCFKSGQEFLKECCCRRNRATPVISEHDVVPTQLLEKALGSIVGIDWKKKRAVRDDDVIIQIEIGGLNLDQFRVAPKEDAKIKPHILKSSSWNGPIARVRLGRAVQLRAHAAGEKDNGGKARAVTLGILYYSRLMNIMDDPAASGVVTHGLGGAIGLTMTLSSCNRGGCRSSIYA